MYFSTNLTLGIRTKDLHSIVSSRKSENCSCSEWIPLTQNHGPHCSPNWKSQNRHWSQQLETLCLRVSRPSVCESVRPLNKTAWENFANFTTVVQLVTKIKWLDLRSKDQGLKVTYGPNEAAIFKTYSVYFQSHQNGLSEFRKFVSSVKKLICFLREKTFVDWKPFGNLPSNKILRSRKVKA